MRKGSPPPIHEIIVKDGKMTQALVRYLFDISRGVDSVTNETNNLKEFVFKVSSSTSLAALSQSVLVDASLGDVNIKLPSPSESFSENRSFKIAVQKIDISDNIINILPFGSELIVGETSQKLILDGEIYNFITDGADWYLGA